jgi:CorA-like Mg2+ transporter protein
MLVDPPMNAVKVKKDSQRLTNDGSPGDFYIFKGEMFKTRNELWNARDSGRPFKLRMFPHSSEPYHKGCPTVYPLSFCSSKRLEVADLIAKAGVRDLTSPFDETIFYWMNLTNEEGIREVQKNSVDAAHHLLKFIAYHWINTLEAVSHTLAQSEYFSDDNPATRPKHMSTAEWKREFYKVVESSRKINYFRRQMIYFENAMNLNLERLGTSLDCDIQSGNTPVLPRALSDAHKDFKVLAARLKPLRDRADNLSTVANDIASLRAAFQAIEDSATGLSLSILATFIFPFTLVASMFSIADDFLPGSKHFWVFFAVSIPLSMVIFFYLFLARKWEVWRDYRFMAVRSVTTERRSRQSWGRGKGGDRESEKGKGDEE